MQIFYPHVSPFYMSAYLAVVQNLVHRFGNKKDFATIAADHKQETISSLHHKRKTQL